MNTEEFIGKKAYGFRFEEGEYGPCWDSSMEEYIGKIGEITAIDEDSVKIEFDDDYWWYPLLLVNQNLLEPIVMSNYEIY